MSDKGKKLAQGFDLPKPPPRTAVKDKAASRFVKAERKASKASRLRRETGGERLSIYLPPDVVEELRVRCARERRSISDAVTEAVAGWLKVCAGLGGVRAAAVQNPTLTTRKLAK
jgi:hypothetical protein